MPSDSQPATPPTPDLDGVRDRILADLDALDPLEGARGLGAEDAYSCGVGDAEQIVKQHLAAVSRPAEREPVAWGLRDKATGRINAARGQRANAEEIRDQLLAQRIDVELVPLYTRPTPQAAPEVTEADLIQAERMANALDSVAQGAGFQSSLEARMIRRLTAALRAAATGGRDA